MLLTSITLSRGQTLRHLHYIIQRKSYGLEKNKKWNNIRKYNKVNENPVLLHFMASAYS